MLCERVLNGSCIKVGSSQCFNGDPRMVCALRHDVRVRCVSCGGRYSVVCLCVCVCCGMSQYPVA